MSMLPPSTLSLRIGRETGRPLRIWLPLFIVWPFVLLAGLLLAPLVLVAAVVLLPFGYGRALLCAGPCLWSAVCACRGLLVEIHDGDDDVRIALN